jgi:uncharacterized tellurite resistance protein B-like protein
MLKQIRHFFNQHLAPGSIADENDPEYVLRLAVAALLLEMAHMDDEGWPEQRAAVETAVLKHFDLTEREATELLELAEEERTESTDYFQFTRLINNNYLPEQKVKLIELLWRVAYADESLNKYEEHMVRKIADLLHVPHSAFIAAKLGVRQ